MTTTEKTKRTRTGRKAWIGQRKAAIAQKGKSNAPWIVFWNEPATGKRQEKSCGPGKDGRFLATKEANRIHGEIITGTYASKAKGAWDEFTDDYADKSLPRLSDASQQSTLYALQHFERIIKPVRVADINSRTIDDYIARRREERGRKPGSKVSPATINKELRTLKAVLRKAVKWGYMTAMPDVEFELEPETEKNYITPDHFTLIYNACDVAERPHAQGYTAGDWWRAILVTAYMTGWRIGETLDLRRANVDFLTGVAKLAAKSTKGKRAESLRLHPIVLEHLEKLVGFDDLFFHWPNDRRSLYVEFERIQKAAEIHLPCVIERDHDCTDACHFYGFHDERRAFATVNHGNLSDDELQGLMRHRDRKTTLRYKSMGGHLEAATDRLFVPEIRKA